MKTVSPTRHAEFQEDAVVSFKLSRFHGLEGIEYILILPTRTTGYIPYMFSYLPSHNMP